MDEKRRMEKRELQRSREARWRERELQLKAEAEERKAREAELQIRKQKAAEERRKCEEAAAAKRVRSAVITVRLVAIFLQLLLQGVAVYARKHETCFS